MSKISRLLHLPVLYFIFVYLAIFVGFYSYGTPLAVFSRFIWLFMASILVFLISETMSWPITSRLLNVLFYILTPWIIQKSTVISTSHYFTLLVLAYIYIYLKTKQLRVFILGFIISFYLGKTIFFKDMLTYKSLPIYVLSFESLFFRNTLISIKNTIGVFYPEMLPLFLVGLYHSIWDSSEKRFIFSLIPWFVISLFDNLLPGESVIFIVLPLLSLIIFIGFQTVYQKLMSKMKKLIYLLLSFAFLFLILYGIVNFHHYFTAHFLPFILSANI